MITSIEKCLGYTVVCYEVNRFDSINAPTFIKEVKELIQSEQKAVILDLSRVQFMDSSGVGAIITMFKELSSKVPFLLCGAGNNVKNLLELTGISKLFNVYPDQKNAQQALVTFSH